MTSLPSGFRDLASQGLISMEVLTILFRQYNWQQAFMRLYSSAKSSPMRPSTLEPGMKRDLVFVLEYEPMEDVVSLSLILKLITPGTGTSSEHREGGQGAAVPPPSSPDPQFEATLCHTLILHTLAIWEPTHAKLTHAVISARLIVTKFILENRALLLPKDPPLSAEDAACRDCLIWVWVVVAEGWTTILEPRAGNADKGVGLMLELLRTVPELRKWQNVLGYMERFYCFESVVARWKECWLDALKML